jgi:hypothetical protein
LLVEVLVLVDVVPVVALTLGVEEDDGVHCSDIEATVPLIGSEIADSGVPGATLTVKVSFWPVISVTVTVHVSAWAEASGMAARAPMAAASAASHIHSFRRLITCLGLLPPDLLLVGASRVPGDTRRKVLTLFPVCN